jgi:galactokinase
MPSLALVPGEIVSAFRSRFQPQTEPEIYRAPGRVNLIGEHTDYNLGFVFPIALQMASYAAVAPAGHKKLHIYSRDFDQDFEIGVEGLRAAKPSSKWSDYVVGVAQQLVSAGILLEGTDLYIASEVPLGSGLSSSAALEIATAFALLGSRKMPPLEIAQLGQRAETQFVGMPCGIMDQYTSVFGRKGSAIQIDCRSLQHEYVTLPEEARIIAVNSMVKHELGTSAYRERVSECQAAVTAIQAFDKTVESLRDVSLTFFEQIQESIPPVPRRRARHVISDTQRVLEFAAAARARNIPEMGRLFIVSHRSMQYDYEISCEEIDFLVDTAIKIPGVYGSRMTGGGFGGCTVNLLVPDAIPEFRERLAEAYRKRFAKTPVFYDCEPAQGAGRWH